jgi:uncharacterized membrane protein YebE (DUF533 family)
MAEKGGGVLRKLLARLSGREESTGASLIQTSSRIYAARPVQPNDTMRTGFDPRGAKLFRTLVEAGFLVANADDHFDAEERVAFAQVVAEACDEAVTGAMLDALMADLALELASSSIEDRVAVIVAATSNTEEQLAIFKVGVVMAYSSSGLSHSERAVLNDLAEGFDLDRSTTTAILDRAAAQAES